MLSVKKVHRAVKVFVACAGTMFMMAVVGHAGEEIQGEADSHAGHNVVAASGKTNGWVERLKRQTIVEDSIEGNPDRAAKVDRQHERLMSKWDTRCRPI